MNEWNVYIIERLNAWSKELKKDWMLEWKIYRKKERLKLMEWMIEKGVSYWLSDRRIVWVKERIKERLNECMKQWIKEGFNNRWR